MSKAYKTPEQIGAAISQARREKNLTQSQLADLAGTTQKQISLIEAGSQGVRIDKICNVLAALRFSFALVSAQKQNVSRVEDVF